MHFSKLIKRIILCTVFISIFTLHSAEPVTSIQAAFSEGSRWGSSDGKRAVFAQLDGRSGYQFVCDFSKVVGRNSWDIKLNTDITKVSYLTAWIHAVNAASMSSMTWYFQVNGTWYSQSFSLKDGWNQVAVDLPAVTQKAASPKILNTMRISAWRINNEDTELTICDVKCGDGKIAKLPKRVWYEPEDGFIAENSSPVRQNEVVHPDFTKILSVPDILLAGTPVKLVKNSGEFKLPSGIQINEQNVAIDSGVKKMLTDALCAGKEGKAEVVLSISGDISADAVFSREELDKLKTPEAFKLELKSAKAAITGRSQAGVLRGIATLILMANRARFTEGVSLPALTLYDAPRMAFRGFAATPDKRVIDNAFLLRINKLIIALDSFGSPTTFPFESYPVGGKKYTKEELADIFDYARKRGIEPIPYFTSWGRVQYLKNMPDGVKLLVDDVDVKQKGYRNLDVANPETHKVMLKLQEEIIDTLKPESFCIAMDESQFGHMNTSAAAKAKNWKPSDWFVEAITVNDAFFKNKGVKMYVWGDVMDPGYSGKEIDMSGPPLIARLPKDMHVLDWKYDGRKDFTFDTPSIKMFRDAGLPTIAASWYHPKSITRLAYSIIRHNGDGIHLTAWNDVAIDKMPPEFIRAEALTAFYSWSPDDCNLANIPFLPDAIMQGAAYWTRIKFPAGKTTGLTVNEGLVSGNKLTEVLGLTAVTGLNFITAPFKNYRGVGFNVFSKDGKPAAITSNMSSGKTSNVIPVNSFARAVTFMHTVNCQDIEEGDDPAMHNMTKKFKDSVAGKYLVTYENGDCIEIPLPYRIRISAINDPALGQETDIGLFGTVGNKLFVNIPTYTWPNPHPEKIIKSIEVLPGNTKDMTLLVFGITLD